MPEKWQPTNDLELELEGARLTRLMYEQPRAVVDTVRQLPVDADLERFVVANILVDGGREAADHASVRKGVDRLEELRTRNPADGRFAYGLAHGVGVLAELDPTPHPDWFWRTTDQRRRARLLYGSAVREAAATAPAQEQPIIISAALVNLADELWSANRWVEAYDVLVAACQIDPANGVAAAVAKLGVWRLVARPTALSPEHQILHLVVLAKPVPLGPGRSRWASSRYSWRAAGLALSPKASDVARPKLGSTRRHDRLARSHTGG